MSTIRLRRFGELDRVIRIESERKTPCDKTSAPWSVRVVGARSCDNDAVIRCS